MSDYTRKQWLRIRALRPDWRWFHNDGTYAVGHNAGKRAEKPAKRMTQPKVEPTRKRNLKSVIYLREISKGQLRPCRDIRRDIRTRRA